MKKGIAFLILVIMCVLIPLYLWIDRQIEIDRCLGLGSISL